MHKLLPLALAGVLTACSSADSAPSTSPVTAPHHPGIVSYEAHAKTLVADLSGNIVPADAESRLDGLIADGVALVPELARSAPHCEAYWKAAARVRREWRAMDFEAIERGYHDDAALPPIVGNATACYHLKDMIVHPAIAQVLLSEQPARIAKAKRELEEVLAHVAAVGALIAPKG